MSESEKEKILGGLKVLIAELEKVKGRIECSFLAYKGIEADYLDETNGIIKGFKPSPMTIVEITIKYED